MKKRVVAFLLAAAMVAGNCVSDLSYVQASNLAEPITDDRGTDEAADVDSNADADSEGEDDETVIIDADSEGENDETVIINADAKEQTADEIVGVEELDAEISDQSEEEDESAWKAAVAGKYNLSEEELENLFADISEWYQEEDSDKQDALYDEILAAYSLSEDDFANISYMYVSRYEGVEVDKESWVRRFTSAVASLFSLSSEPTYADFTEDEVIADLAFGSQITVADVYDSEKGYGFSTVEFPNEATGWVGSVYYPRVENVTESDASYVKNADGALAISSKVWTETESTGYGVYTYENTSTFDYDLYNADYEIAVTFVNPTSAAYSAYVEAEDITKASGIEVEAGKTTEVEFTACLVDGTLNLKFLGTSGATTESAAATQTVYVSNVKITRLATNEAREDEKPTIYIASDSTVQSYDSYYYPQTGWGQVLAEFFGDGDYEEVTSETAGYSQSKTYEVSNAVIENRAIGGRSSSSFVLEGKLDDLLEDIRPGDYLLIQWGHNDSTYTRPNRYVSSTEFEKWLQIYVDGAIERGATPILVTPVARYSYITDDDGNLISYASNFEAYRQVMIKMSQEQGIALIDLTQRSIDVANSFGIDGGKSLWLYTNAGDYPGSAYAGGSTDSTHLQWYGAYKFAQCVATGIVEAGNSEVYTNENYVSGTNKTALQSLAGLIDLRAATTQPNKITGLASGTVGASSVSMSWDADDESEMYYIYRAEVTSEEAGAAYEFSDSDKKYSVSRNAKYTDTGCEAGKTYVYAVRGYNSLGLGEFSNTIVVTTKSAGYRFDFNYNNSATQDGWTGVNQNQMYDATLGYGWITAPNNGRYRGNNGTVSDDLADMAGDFNLGAGEFAVDLPNGDYEVTIYAADLLAGTSTIKPSYTAEGASFGSISCKQALGSVTGTVRVTDGQLNIVVGGTNQYISGMTVTEILKAPTALIETEASVSGSTYTALLSFTGVDEAVGYNYYVKGSTDSDYKLERTFDSAKYALGVTEYGAISVNLGENYEYYVTCFTADGTESAPSNTITVSAQLDVATPAAPQNVACVDPTEDTEGVQNTITISWDASEVTDSTYPVIKYIIYRSDKAEGEKGFKEYVKVGESTTTSFTDESEGIATNISYYYKVCASNAGGSGALSEACKTPVTGSLVAGSLETLTDRALTAIKLSESVTAIGTDGTEYTEGVYLSWRAFKEEFNADNEVTTTFTVKVNGTVVAKDLKTTNVVLTDVDADAVFTVEGSADASVNGGLNVIPTKAWENQYIEMQLYKPEDETMPDGSTCNYTANDMSVGDVDADGQLELIVKWYPSNAKDNSGSGYTGKTFLDTYDIDWNTGAATLLSRIDLGVNIRSGAHYTQFQVWDYDGDGKAEIAVKTADGSTIYKSEDGTAATLTMVDYVGECSTEELPTDVVSTANDYRNSSGYILSGPEYFTMFNPEDGTILDTVEYIPGRGTVSKWGDAYGNRVDRFLSATAYLDGVHPFAVMCRGYYTRTTLTAYGTKDTDGDGIGDKIYTYWAYDTDNGDGPEGQGNHNLSVADVDNDGKDEIIYGSSCYDNDGTLKYSTGLGHGDAMHVSDWVSWNDGLEVLEVHEEANQTYQVEIHDAETGKIIIGYPVLNADVGRGVAADIDPTSLGAEFWASNGPGGEGTGEWDSTDSSVIGTENSGTTTWDILSYGATPAANATLYWDGDLLAEIQDHKFNNKNGNYYPEATLIAKWNYETNEQENLLYSEDILTSNGTKGNLGLIADLTGDWRDEFIARCAEDDSKIRLYTTTYETDYVIPCSLDDLQYREGVAWENVAYNQPTHTSYLVSQGLVTAQLSVGETTASSAEILFTPANDGTLYGHDVTAYEIYRGGEKIATVDADKLVKKNASTEDAEETEQEREIIGYNENTIYSFDIGTKKGTADGFIGITNNRYDETTGYGFSSDTTIADYGSKGTYVSATDEAISVACRDVAYANGNATFLIDVSAGTYRVDVYAGSLGGAADTTISVNDENLGTVVGTTGTTAESMLKSTEVTMAEAGQISVTSNSASNARAVLSAIVITELEPIYAEAEETEEAAEASNTVYSFVDTGLSANTTYSYKIAAVVDGKTSYMSRAAEVKTLIKIASISDFELDDIVEGTEVAESVAELLPSTISVIDEAGNEQEASVTWDVSAVDINTAGKYTVIGTVAGYSDKIEKTLRIVANELKGIAAQETVVVIAGNTAALPETVDVEYTNGKKDAAAVTWDTTKVDYDTIGEYEVEGSVAGFDEKASIVIRVVSDYAVSVDTTYIEIAIGDSIVDALPETVLAAMASGNKASVAVTWKTDGVNAIDTTTPSEQMIHGTVENLDADVLCDVTVAYPALYKFDFGISDAIVADGWTAVTVNAKGGTKTASELGIAYTTETGYGFENPDAVIEGRTESVEGTGVYPTNVTTDFALMTGQTFAVDVPNGEYLVQIMTTCGIGSTAATVEVEGTSASFSANKSYTIQSYTVTVEDGQLTITDKSSLARIGAIVVRSISAVETDNSGNDAENQEPTDSEASGSNNSTSDAGKSESVTTAATVITSIASTIETVKETVADTVTEVVNTVKNAVTNIWNRVTGRTNQQNTTTADVAEEETAGETQPAAVEDTQTPLAEDNTAATNEESVSIEDEQVPTSANAGVGSTAAVAGGIAGVVLLAAAFGGFAYAKKKKK